MIVGSKTCRPFPPSQINCANKTSSQVFPNYCFKVFFTSILISLFIRVAAFMDPFSPRVSGYFSPPPMLMTAQQMATKARPEEEAEEEEALPFADIEKLQAWILARAFLVAEGTPQLGGGGL